MPTAKRNTRAEMLRALYQRDKFAEEARMVAPAEAALEMIVEGAEAGDPNTSVSNDGVEASIGDVSQPDFGKEGQPSGASPEVTHGAEAFLASAEAASDATVDESLLLDAYWANYGDASTLALLRSQPEEGSSILEVVIGEDDRKEINTTRDYPWRCICSLLITAADGSAWIGTGWFVGPRTLLTAGHCVYIHNRGGWVQRIEVIPGRKASERPFGSCAAASFRSVTGWTQNRDRNFDYAAILLPSNCRFGDTVGWFGYAVRNDSALQTSQVNISGYPGDKPAGTQWFHAKGLATVDEKVLTYTADTAGGQSGAPVWIQEAGGKRFGVGIHTNGHITGNSATRINQAVFDNIQQWKSQAS